MTTITRYDLYFSKDRGGNITAKVAYQTEQDGRREVGLIPITLTDAEALAQEITTAIQNDIT